MNTTSSTERKTFTYDCLRGAFNGIIYSGLMSMAILIAIRYHNAPAWMKTIIASADSIGRLVTPLTLVLATVLCIPVAQVLGYYMIGTALMLCCVAIAPSLLFYTIAIVAVYLLFAQPPQMMLPIYSNNYSDSNRGNRVATMFVISTLIGIIVAQANGRLLDVSLEYHRLTFVFLAFCAMICWLAARKIPSEPLRNKEFTNPLANLSWLWRDRVFGIMILGYILLGVGNGMVIPLRVEYMANFKYEVNATNFQVILINVVIPGASMVVSTQIWGILFDKLKFITTRLLVNACFILGYLMFFASKSIVIMGVSAAMNGFAIAGGMIIWNLWVTKIAPKDRIPAYMSSHTATSGLKGIAAPVLTYSLVGVLGPQNLSFLAAALMLLSCGIFWSLRHNPRIL